MAEPALADKYKAIRPQDIHPDSLLGREYARLEEIRASAGKRHHQLSQLRSQLFEVEQRMASATIEQAAEYAVDAARVVLLTREINRLAPDVRREADAVSHSELTFGKRYAEYELHLRQLRENKPLHGGLMTKLEREELEREARRLAGEL